MINNYDPSSGIRKAKILFVTRAFKGRIAEMGEKLDEMAECEMTTLLRAVLAEVNSKLDIIIREESRA